MQLLLLDDTLRAYPAPEVAYIKEFRALIKRDRGGVGDTQGRKKLRAVRELTYIYHCISHQSPYANTHFQYREEKAKHDIFGEKSTWQPDELVIDAMQKYEEMSSTPSVDLLKAGIRASQKLIAYFDDVDLTLLDEKDKPIYSSRDLVMNLANLGKVVEGLLKLQEQVEKDLTGEDRNRKSVITNEFSE